MKTTTLLGFLAAVTKEVLGHGAVTDYVIDGVLWPGYQGFSPASGPVTMERQWPDYNPILDCTLSTIRCNGGTSAGDVGVIAAGDKITAQWAQWTHIPGTVTVYLYPCAGAFASCDGSGANWFKIDGVGLVSGTVGNGQWGPGLVMDTLAWTTTIPANLKAGNYLIRHELMAIHQANTPQFYPECGQLQVTGSGTAVPSGDYLVEIPSSQFCSMSNPEIDINIYDTSTAAETTYDMAGPAIWPSGATGNNAVPSIKSTHTFSGTAAATTATTSHAQTTTLSTSTVRTTSSGTTSSTSTATNTPAACAAVKYGQCGGIGWTGCTSCASGSTCQANGAYYSQCL
jgi:hypothetical protein